MNKAKIKDFLVEEHKMKQINTLVSFDEEKSQAIVPQGFCGNIFLYN